MLCLLSHIRLLITSHLPCEFVIHIRSPFLPVLCWCQVLTMLLNGFFFHWYLLLLMAFYPQCTFPLQHSAHISCDLTFPHSSVLSRCYFLSSWTLTEHICIFYWSAIYKISLNLWMSYEITFQAPNSASNEHVQFPRLVGSVSSFNLLPFAGS